MTQSYAKKVREELNNVVGTWVPDLVMQKAVVSLSSSEVCAFEGPTQEMLSEVHDYVSKLCSAVIQKIFETYPQLRDHVVVVVDMMLEESLEKCREQLSEQLAIESDEVYTLNHYYSDTVTKVMARSDEVVIGDSHESSDVALQVL